MGGCRQTFSLWFHIKMVFKKPTSEWFTRWKRFVDLVYLFRRQLGNRYFWHDSFGRYINQLLICKLIGHRTVHWLDDGGCGDKDNRPQWHCFNCEREVDPEIDFITKEGE